MRKIILLFFCLVLFSNLKPQNRVCSYSDSLTLYYDIDQYELNSTHKEKLFKGINKVGIQNIDQVEIKAYADDLASSAYNQNLSESRARAVKDYLLQNKIEAGQIGKCLGLGEIEGGNLNEKGNWLNRKVEVRFGTKKILTNGVSKVSYKPLSSCENNSERRIVRKISNITSPICWNIVEHRIPVIGDTIWMFNLGFQAYEPYLIPEYSFPLLDRLVFLLKQYPGINLEIQGPTLDKDMSYQVNLKKEQYKVGELQEKRNDEIIKYLVYKGIDPNRLTNTQWTGTRPIATNPVTNDKFPLDWTHIFIIN